MTRVFSVRGLYDDFDLVVEDDENLYLDDEVFPFTVQVDTAEDKLLTLFKALSITESKFLENRFIFDEVPQEPERVQDWFTYRARFDGDTQSETLI